MLVCSVVLRPERLTVAADLVEIAEALDVPSLGTIFATLTDNPGNALDIIDAFTGSRLVEAATATDTINALSAHPATVLEEISAAVAAQDAIINAPVVLVPRQSMVGTVMINSDGTARQANVDGTMVNL